MTPRMSLFINHAAVLLLLLGVSARSLAQTAATASGPKAAVDSTLIAPAGEYMLASDDVIEITVANHADLNKLHVVRPDGKITVPELGEIQAAGKTPRQLAAEIEKSYSRTLRNAEISIDVRETHRTVAITSTNSGLHSSGYFPMKPNMRLMDLVTAAGGVLVKPERISGKLVRNSRQVIELDMVRAMHDPLSEANIPLQPNDLVLLDAKQPLREDVSVFGQVGHTGQYVLDEQSTLVSLLATAGGVTEGAALKDAYVLRNGDKLPINLYPAIKDGKSDPAVNDFKLKVGDEVFIPEIQNRYSVLGQVQKPGRYFIPEKAPVNVLEALSLAGGQLPTGDLGKAGILREVDGKQKVITVNLNMLMKKPASATDFKMRNDDVLYVPPRGARGLVWQDILTPITALSFLGFRLFN